MRQKTEKLIVLWSTFPCSIYDVAVSRQQLVSVCVFHCSMRVNYLDLCCTPTTPNTVHTHTHTHTHTPTLMLIYTLQSGESRASKSSRSDITLQHLCKLRHDSRRPTLLSALLISKYWGNHRYRHTSFIDLLFWSGSSVKWLRRNLRWLYINQVCHNKWNIYLHIWSVWFIKWN